MPCSVVASPLYTLATVEESIIERQDRVRGQGRRVENIVELIHRDCGDCGHVVRDDDDVVLIDRQRFVVCFLFNQLYLQQHSQLLN